MIRYPKDQKPIPSWSNDITDEFETVNCAALEENKTMAIQLPDKIKKSKGTAVTAYSGFPSVGGQGGTWTNGTYVTHYKNCKHVGDKVIFESDGKKLFAAAGRDLDEYSGKWDLIIDLAYNIREQSSFVKKLSAKRFDVLRQFEWKAGKVKSETLCLDWPDMGTPPCGLEFWQTLWDLLPKTSVIACVGGHGRTGTCLASFMISQGIDYYSAIDSVRADHCDKAIESLPQEKYLHSLYIDKMMEDLQAATLEGNTKEMAEIQLDIDYANAHVPNNKSSHGEEVKVIVAEVTESKKKVSPVGSHLGASEEESPSPYGTDYARAMESADDFMSKNTKRVGGIEYINICVDNTCPDQNCENPDHMGWVEWDTAAMLDL